ncbi:MAG: hypothetical protein K1X72_23275 [Pyrinomonadaceae bacterium]|nr:hypothetical protein [Pyrinomonadaceae bacterium]
MKKAQEILGNVCQFFGHCWSKWKAESDAQRCVFWFWRKCVVCGEHEYKNSK